MSNREEFELFEKLWHPICPVLDAITSVHAYSLFKACAANYEAERNSLLAVIAEKDKALHSALACKTLTGDFEHIEYTLEQALALTPENVRLVEVGFTSTGLIRDSKKYGTDDVAMWLKYDENFNEQASELKKKIGYKTSQIKLYTIETIEAKGE